MGARGLSYKAHRVLLPEKSKVMLYLPFITRLKPFNQLYITNKTELFSFKSGRAVRVAKLTKEDWPIVLRHKTTLYYFQKVLSLKYTGV